ncbi:MAG: rhomboid family intramembrane serine protease [Chloroflexi bacterium]|nr:rhomboid family intramembrane serine protease [Chloroflexota bacterium]
MIPISDPDLRRRSWPYVTVALLLLNVAVFIYELSLGPLERTAFIYRWGLIPAELTRGREFTELVTTGGVLDIASPLPAWGMLFSSMFLHGGFMHVLGNMVYLWVFGDNVEDRLGHTKYLLFYLAAGIAAAWVQIAADVNGRVPTIGASGAIAGVLGAYLLLYPQSRINTLVLWGFISIIRIPAVFLLGFWFVLQFFSGVGSLGVASQGGVAYWAHVGGFVAGALVVALYLRLRGERIWRPRS